MPVFWIREFCMRTEMPDLQNTVRATLRIRSADCGLGGQAVLVPGGFILTAAHCIKDVGHSDAALGDYFPVHLETPVGPVVAGIAAIEPFADVAVLAEFGAPEAYPDESEAFEDLVDEVCPANLYFGPWDRPIPVFVRSHEGFWISGEYRPLTSCEDGRRGSGSGAVFTSQAIECGSSGGPVVTAQGRLVGVMSNSCEQRASGEYQARIPLLAFALPGWILPAIRHEA